MFIFDAGQLDPDQISRLQPDPEELRRFAFLELDEAQHRLRPYVWLRLEAALKAVESQQWPTFTTAIQPDEPLTVQCRVDRTPEVPAIEVRAWNNGAYHRSGSGYLLKLRLADRDSLIDPASETPC